ncbi:MAG TPA: NAD(P)-dependent alcohol dehydrogenase [Pedobacter sp.]
MAEYVLVKEKNLAIKPQSISFEQAAALPVAGLSALQILSKIPSIKTDTEILINGATGGIGMFLTQFAKQQGAIVTAVTNTKGMALVEKWQSDFSIDYRKQDVFKLDKQFDVVVDLSGKMSFNAVKVLLKKRATFISTLPSPRSMVASFINNLFSARKYQILILKPSAANLKALVAVAEKNIDVVIDKSFPISSIKEAYQYAMKGNILGKVIITFE